MVFLLSMERLFSWEATLAIMLGLPGIGLAFLALDDFRMAKLCFLVAAADAIEYIVWQTSEMQTSSPAKMLLVFVLTGVVGVAGQFSLKYVDRKKEQKEKRPQVAATTNTRVVARLYARMLAPPPGQTGNANFSFQEIFYEYSVTLTASGQSTASLK